MCIQTRPVNGQRPLVINGAAVFGDGVAYESIWAAGILGAEGGRSTGPNGQRAAYRAELLRNKLSMMVTSAIGPLTKIAPP